MDRNCCGSKVLSKKPSKVESFSSKLQRSLNSLKESKSNNGENSAIHLLLAEFEVRVFFALNLWPKLEEKAPKIAESQLAY